MNQEHLKGILVACLCFAFLGLGAMMIKQNRELAHLVQTMALSQSSPQEMVRKNAIPSSPVIPTRPTDRAQVASDTDLQPVVAFIRPGLLTTQNKSILQKKLVEPITAFYNETKKQVVALVITVPQTPSMEYNVILITKDGGTEEFGFSLKGENTRWWLPTCMDADDCGFTPAFKAKFPEVVAGIR